MTREAALAALSEDFDILIIGGGATGLGIAVDAVSRGFRTALVEAGDYAQATSSRATKLVHGGVRYLASGQIHLVYEALHERAVMLRNAPHLVKPQAFLLPTYTHWERPYFAAGLKLYDVMSGRSTMGATRMLSKAEVLASIPNLQGDALSGGILYYDGQFNDARLALALARTAEDRGATMLNYVRCVGFMERDGKLSGATVRDVETGKEYEINARVIFNATGIFTDELRTMDEPSAPPLLTVSRGSHIVVNADCLGGSAGIMVPKTPDGRVIFAIPWQGKVVVGTTDLPAGEALMEPGFTGDEIDYLLETINPYLARPIARDEILSVFSGLRPLVTGKGSTTSKISREHHIEVSKRGLITIAGGKWTTYRRMAEDALSFAASRGMLAKRACITSTLALHGAGSALEEFDPILREYGSDIPILEALCVEEPALREWIDPALPYTFAEVVFAARYESARTLEDVLSRRTRSLLLDARAAVRCAPRVAAVLATELGRDGDWADAQVRSFTALASLGYMPVSRRES